ncbi:hypothetical protein [Mastigocoleus testarum]|uniref:Uncharacterized protein n=1 Tax=Mastigocoleus testarum BC008 TaxID=371196 RepID=A0A0V7ZCM0_9CYAN|nr:hypothetical protein [Mastigocoleus testarum]KST62239.1 hypothetical protein BC008_08700 [Mastigocoleus testarum BC008]
MSNNLSNNLQQIAINSGLALASQNNGTAFSLQINNGYNIDIAQLGKDKYSLTLTEFAPIGNCAEITAHYKNLEFVINWLVEYSDQHKENIAIPETIH